MKPSLAGEALFEKRLSEAAGVPFFSDAGWDEVPKFITRRFGKFKQ